MAQVPPGSFSGSVPPRFASVIENIAARSIEGIVAQHTLERNAYATFTSNGSTILRDFELAAIAFVVGSPVSFKVNEPNAITFTAKNELGIEYKFTVSGNISIEGTPS